MGVIQDRNHYIDEKKKAELFRQVIDILNDNDVICWLEFGTLLGYMREGRFIEWDADIDLGTYQITRAYSLTNLFRAEGLEVELNYNFSDDMTTFMRISNSFIHVDIYGFEKTGDGTVLKCNRYSSKLARLFRALYNEMKRIKIDSRLLLRLAVYFSHKRVFIYPDVVLTERNYYDMPVYIPVNPENHLRLMYGESWMTPTKDDVAGKEHMFKKERKRTFYRLTA